MTAAIPAIKLVLYGSHLWYHGCMSRLVNQTVQKIVDTVSQWDGVDTITLMEGEADIYNPYFFLSVDVYFRGLLPETETRRDLFSYGSVFESSAVNRKDRFLVGEFPVRIEYKDIDRLDAMIHGDLGVATNMADSGTYAFYRLQNCSVIASKSEWLTRVREEIQNLREDFWAVLRVSVQSRMEHFVSDLGAAVMQDDDLFFLVSAAGFARSLCSLLFAINHEFEPSARYLAEHTQKLPILPGTFRGWFESFLRRDSSIAREKKFEIAELLARSVIGL